MLTVDDGRRTHRLAPLPGLDDATPLAAPDAPLWRAAYSAPVELVGRGRPAFALDVGDGLTDLPRPAEGSRSRPAAVPSPARPPSPEDQRRALRVREDRREAMRALQRTLDEERRAREEADRRARAERTERERVEELAAVDHREREQLEARIAALAEARREAEAAAEVASREVARAEERARERLGEERAGREEASRALAAVQAEL